MFSHYKQRKMKAKGDDPLDFRLSKGKRYKGSGNTFHQHFMGIDAILALCSPAHRQDTMLLKTHLKEYHCRRQNIPEQKIKDRFEDYGQRMIIKSLIPQIKTQFKGNDNCLT